MSGVWIALRHALGLAWRHKWTFTVPVATLLLPATLLALRLPDTYEAVAVVQVRELTGGEDRGLLPGERSAQGYALVAMARDRLLARQNVSALVDLLAPGASAEDPKVLEQIAARVEYDRLSDFSFQLAITDTNPVRAAQAVNRLLDTFLENERRDPLERARSNLVHYEKEAAAAEAAYRAAYDAYEAFRTAHSDSLPERREALSAQLAGLLAQRAEAQGRVARHGERIGELEQELTRPPASDGGSQPGARVQRLMQQLSDQQKALSEAERRLAVVRSQVTDEHPAVKHALAQVEALRRPIQDTERELDAARREDQAQADVRRGERLKDWEEQQRRRIERERGALARSHADVERVNREIATAEQALATIPATAQALVPLRQAVEYAEKDRVETSRLASQAASVAAFMEGQDPGRVTPYRIAQRAVPPAEPSGPRRKAWLLTALGLGLLIGYGLLMLQRRFSEPVIEGPNELAGLLPGALIVRVPALPTGDPVLKRLPWTDLALGAYVLACLTTTALAIAHHRGLVEAPALLQRLLEPGGA